MLSDRVVSDNFSCKMQLTNQSLSSFHPAIVYKRLLQQESHCEHSDMSRMTFA